MFREDVVFLVPAVVIALFQVKIIWGGLPPCFDRDTETSGKYTEFDRLRLSYFIYGAYFLFFGQLAIPILIITKEYPFLFFLRLSGYTLILLGFLLSVLALKALGDNWTGMDYYRIKIDQRLVTSGVYAFVRHPIYLSVLLEIIGFELIANSFLSMVLPAIGFWVLYKHIILEEELLELKFKGEYRLYKRRVKMLVPYVY